MTEMRDLRTILICGAGPVGLTAAIELARRGFRPRLLDRKPGPTPLVESRALAVNARTLQLLAPSGAAEAILAEAQLVKELRIRTDSRILATLDATAMPGGSGGMHCLPQGRTERILLERLEPFGITPEWRTEILGTEGDPSAPAVRLQRPDGTPEVARADLVIDAEGAHSPIRRGLGLGFPGESVENVFYLADHRYVRPVDTSVVSGTLHNPGATLRIPVSADVIRTISTMPDFEDRIVHPAPLAGIPWQTQFRVSFRHVEPMAKGAFFLAGDAAHIHSPVGGRGMNLGIEDACWLAWLISESREAEYSALRVQSARAVLALTHRMTSMILMRNPLAIALRNMALPVATRLPALRRRLLTAAAGLDTPPPPWLAGTQPIDGPERREDRPREWKMPA
ncbi:MAG: FAD-dependent oxidoreductase [Pararhizobium sp.]